MPTNQQIKSQMPPDGASAARFVVPVEFVAQEPLRRVLVDERAAWELCGISGRNPGARRLAFWRLRKKLSLTVLPGRLFSYEELQRKVRAATLEEAEIRRLKAARQLED